mmetsp:Transcript_14046/g.39782  ORF Transcript_14046/g.39782 Transcript_14046/m.39782 type:complete len:346 (+) Transcript_14046:163-1200(+)
MMEQPPFRRNRHRRRRAFHNRPASQGAEPKHREPLSSRRIAGRCLSRHRTPPPLLRLAGSCLLHLAPLMTATCNQLLRTAGCGTVASSLAAAWKPLRDERTTASAALTAQSTGGACRPTRPLLIPAAKPGLGRAAAMTMRFWMAALCAAGQARVQRPRPWTAAFMIVALLRRAMPLPQSPCSSGVCGAMVSLATARRLTQQSLFSTALWWCFRLSRWPPAMRASSPIGLFALRGQSQGTLSVRSLAASCPRPPTWPQWQPSLRLPPWDQKRLPGREARLPPGTSRARGAPHVQPLRSAKGIQDSVAMVSVPAVILKVLGTAMHLRLCSHSAKGVPAFWGPVTQLP